MKKADSIVPLPAAVGAQETDEKLKSLSPWFYQFSFSNGVVSDSTEVLIDEIHNVRAELIFPYLDKVFGERWNDVSCVDIGCHEGWWSTQLAARGAKSVLGIDPRDSHLERASVIQELTTLDNISYKNGNIYSLNPSEIGTFDLCLFVGVLYHLDNPADALSKVRSLTHSLCVIETQVARPTPDLTCLWGSDTEPKSGPGIAVIRSDPNHIEGGRSFVLVPTLEALYKMLYYVGFKEVTLSKPRPEMFSQYRDLERVVVFASV